MIFLETEGSYLVRFSQSSLGHIAVSYKAFDKTIRAIKLYTKAGSRGTITSTFVLPLPSYPFIPVGFFVAGEGSESNFGTVEAFLEKNPSILKVAVKRDLFETKEKYTPHTQTLTLTRTLTLTLALTLTFSNSNLTLTLTLTLP